MRITRPYKSLEAELHFFEYKESSTVEFTEDVEALAKTAETANTKKDSAHAPQPHLPS